MRISSREGPGQHPHDRQRHSHDVQVVGVVPIPERSRPVALGDGGYNSPQGADPIGLVEGRGREADSYHCH